MGALKTVPEQHVRVRADARVACCVLQMQMPDDVARRMALRCENLGEIQLACKVLRHTRSPGDEIALLASRAQVASEGKDGDYFEKLDLPPARTFKDEVKSALRRKDTARAVRCHVIAQQHEEAAKLAVKSWTSAWGWVPSPSGHPWSTHTWPLVVWPLSGVRRVFGSDVGYGAG